MAGSQRFSPGDIQFQLVYDRGQCAETSYLTKYDGALWDTLIYPNLKMLA